MSEITEIDMEKYIVLKKDDINNLKGSDGDIQRAQLRRVIHDVSHNRFTAKKEPKPQYLVLNTDDEIDVDHLCELLCGDGYVGEPVKVKDIAVDLINAISRAKGNK